MNEETMRRRKEKVRKAVMAATMHIANAVSALNDANLYSVSSEEEIIDVELGVLEKVTEALNKNILGTEQVKKSADEFANFFDRKGRT